MLHLLVAFMHEARPLIDHYRLAKAAGAHPYPIYANDQIKLIVSGIGKTAAAAGVGYLQALGHPSGTIAWLNLGIAGHGTLGIGQGFLAHRVEDQATGRCAYPPLVFPFSAKTSDLLTVDQPLNRYEANCGYDMEASGFVQSALRGATAEWVQCYKVVSDNPSAPLGKFDKARAMTLIENRLDEIDPLVSMLIEEVLQWRAVDDSDSALDEITKRYHFSETRRVQLRRLLRRWKALEATPILSSIDLDSYPNAASLLDDVRQRLSLHRLAF